ncbi:MAG: winged helix-turn-helix domain-containing protein [SAR324 cluster bacterium]|nr:winged helix-turn-helix domain-containing protein [SAR324 cluster bacterium]
MKKKILTKNDVYQIILERINNGSFTIGTKLPPCRTLAKEIQSNITTVNRAIQQLANEGIIRSEARKGSFIAKKKFSNLQGVEKILDEFKSVIRNAHNAGFSEQKISSLFKSSLNDNEQLPKIAFAECNKFDLNRMTKIIENSTGVSIIPIFIDDITEDNINNWDLIATPIFHISEVIEKTGSTKNILGLNFLPNSEVLNKIAQLEKTKTVTVIAPTDRGVERMLSLVKQYFPGDVVSLKDFKSAESSFSENDIIITNRAASLEDQDFKIINKVIIVDWELDYESAENFRLRIKKIINE